MKFNISSSIQGIGGSQLCYHQLRIYETVLESYLVDMKSEYLTGKKFNLHQSIVENQFDVSSWRATQLSSSSYVSTFSLN